MMVMFQRNREVGEGPFDKLKKKNKNNSIIFTILNNMILDLRNRNFKNGMIFWFTEAEE